MNQNALYALIAGLFLSLAFSTTTTFGSHLSFAFQLIGGLLAIGVAQLFLEMYSRIRRVVSKHTYRTVVSPPME
jgi:hypothetical protein